MLFGEDDRRKGERRREADDLFAAFWERYPKKVARIDAVRAWNKLRPDAALLEMMLTALEWQCRQWTDRRYIPNPASWLNGARWEDEQPARPVKDVGYRWECRHVDMCSHQAMCRIKDEMPHKYPVREEANR